MIDIKTATEEEMRECEAPWFKEADELHQFIDNLVDRQHDYGTCVYAMSLAAIAAYNYVAHRLGVTGFQASCADMDIIRRNRNIEYFSIFNIGDALYPQYDLVARLENTLEEAKPWLAKKAQEALDENDSFACKEVVAHWEKLASYKEPEHA